MRTPYVMDSESLRVAAAHWQVIVSDGAEQRFHEELFQRLRQGVCGGLRGNSFPASAESWASSFGKQLAGILDAPVYQCVGAAMDLLPISRRQVALELLAEMAAEITARASVRNATTGRYPRRVG